MKCLQFLLLIGFCLSISSCSLTFEKRRYRPGYHVDMVKTHSMGPSNGNDKITEVNRKDNNTQILSSEYPATEFKVIDPELINEHTDNGSKIILEKSNKVNRSNGILHRINFNKADHGKKIFHVNKTKGLREKKIAAWVLGGLSMSVFAVGVGMSFISWGGIGLIIFGICLAIAVLFALIALIVRYAGAKKLENEEPPPYVPISSNFVNGSFIFSIITLSLALLSFIFSFLIYPFGLVAFSLGIVSIVAAITTFSLGFRALKDDKSLKTKLIIIFGFIALILAVLAILLVFL